MGGGTEVDFARAEPILAAMDKAVIHAGANGAGQVAKICNNMLLGASMVATREAFRLAERLGLDLQTFYDISSKASGRCWSMTSYCPVPMGHRAEELYAAFDTAGMAGWIFRPLSRRFERAVRFQCNGKAVVRLILSSTTLERTLVTSPWPSRSSLISRAKARRSRLATRRK